MRALLLALPLSILTLLPSSGNAGDGSRQIAALDSEKIQRAVPNLETYRGYFLDLSEIAERQDYAKIADAMRHQIDIVEGAGLSARVLKILRTVPIVVDEAVCLQVGDKALKAAGCYGGAAGERSRRPARAATVWDNEKRQWTNPDPVDLAVDTGRGVVMIRPFNIRAQRPLLLHEMLHAYHANVMPGGFRNPGIMLHYKFAKGESLYPADAYLMTNHKEFFAVTASVFLFGKDGDKEPGTRANLKQKQPDYYEYLKWLFGFDPDGEPSIPPIASAH